jgi:hypothetical protein
MSGSFKYCFYIKYLKLKRKGKKEGERDDGSRVYKGSPSRGALPELGDRRLKGLLGESQVTM